MGCKLNTESRCSWSVWVIQSVLRVTLGTRSIKFELPKWSAQVYTKKGKETWKQQQQQQQPINQGVLVDVWALALTLFIGQCQYPISTTLNNRFIDLVWFEKDLRGIPNKLLIVSGYDGGSMVWAIPKWCDRTPKTGPIKAIWLTHTHNQHPAQRMPIHNQDMKHVLQKAMVKMTFQFVSYSLLH